jgi:hypothetical protein
MLMSSDAVLSLNDTGNAVIFSKPYKTDITTHADKWSVIFSMAQTKNNLLAVCMLSLL